MKVSICKNSHEIKSIFYRPLSESHLWRTDYKTQIFTPKSDSEEDTNYGDIEGHLIPADKVDLEELEQLKAEINLARLNFYKPMNANPQAV